jgi:two-component system CheB/CheR fusion protein
MTDERHPAAPDDPGGGPGLGERKRRRLEGPMRATPAPESAELRLQHELDQYRAGLESQTEELRQAHAALDAARARYQDLYDAAPVGLLTIGMQGRILTLNQRAADLLGLEPTPPHPRFTELMSAPTVAAYERERGRLLAGDAPVALEAELRRVNGGPLWVQMTMSLAREADGSVVLQLALMDVSAQKRMQEEAARLAAIVTSAEQAILTENLGGIIDSWNAGAERLFGYTSSEAIGQDSGLLVPPDRVAEERAIQSRVRHRSSHVHETIRRRRDGTPVSVLVATAPILDGAGRVVGISHIVQDMTNQVEARREVQRLLRDLREADRRKDTFIATLAHELRNPLAPIRNAAAVLRFAPDLDPKLEWCRDVIDRQVKHMGALLEDLLDVSRLTRDTILLRWDRVELGTVIVQAVETTRHLIEARRHKLALDLPSEPIEVEGDLTRLVQIFANLLSNAAKYTPPGGDIRVQAVRHQSEVIVSVRDSGIGLDPGHIDKLFELFSQIDPEAEASAGGLGIGLALVKGLVERHRGTVIAHSEGPGKGSEFVVTLPTATSTAVAKERAAISRRQDGSRDRSRRLLVVDDNVDAAESMAIVLRMEGYEVRTSHDGETAIAIATDFRPQVILLDLGMPKMNGFDVARRIRREPWGQDVVLVACTGWGQPEDRRRSKAAGFDHHLVKPVSPETVVDLVDALTRPMTH